MTIHRPISIAEIMPWVSPECVTLESIYFAYIYNQSINQSIFIYT